MIVAYKNYKRTERLLLCIRSVKHFMPDVQIHCLNLFDEAPAEYDSDIDAFKKLGVDVHFAKNKHKCGPGFGSPCNGFYYTEYLNYFSIMFQDLNEKVIAMDEDVYFTTGQTLAYLRDTDFDLAWANWWWGVNGGILGINFNRLAKLFPLPEIKLEIEKILKAYLLDKAVSSGFSVAKIPTRDSENYFGDGSYTNDTMKVKSDLVAAKILSEE
jgi:hypothetical protein